MCIQKAFIARYIGALGILLIVDFNTRTACMNDTYENDIYTDDYLDCTHEIDYNLHIRNNQDKTINHQCRKLIEFCQTTDMIIVNGRFGMDRVVGHYTCQRYEKVQSIMYYYLLLLSHI